MKKRVKIEVADGDREKVTITLEGDMSRERILHLMDLLQLLNITDKARPEEPEELSKFEKIRLLIKRKFPTGWFTSQDIMVAYEDSYDEPIGLSTVSTYLVRLVDRGDVTKSGSITTRRYRIRKTEVPDEGNRGLANLD